MEAYCSAAVTEEPSVADGDNGVPEEEKMNDGDGGTEDDIIITDGDISGEDGDEIITNGDENIFDGDEIISDGDGVISDGDGDSEADETPDDCSLPTQENPLYLFFAWMILKPILLCGAYFRLTNLSG